MIEFLSSRSRVEDTIRCPRARWELHERDNTGYELIKRALPLAAGTSIHLGLADLLRGKGAEEAVQGAVKDYEQQVEGRGLDLQEMESQSFVFGEQRALVEALIRLAALRVIPRLLEIYKILEVERLDVETLWEEAEEPIAEAKDLAKWILNPAPAYRILWRSIPDALMRHRETGDLYLLSWKTCSELPREDDARIDMQGRSEAWAVEQRLKRIWEPWSKRPWDQSYKPPETPDWFRSGGFCDSLLSPRIRGIQMVYLVKGQRRDAGQPGRELQGIPAEVEGKAYKTGSPLIYGYHDGSSVGSPKLAWASMWQCSFPHPMRKSSYYSQGQCPGDGRNHKRGDEWKSFPVWQTLGIKEWLRMLDQGEVTPEAGDCLDAQWAMPVPNFRTVESIEDWRQQTIGQEKRIAEDLLKLRDLETDASGNQWVSVDVNKEDLNLSSLGVQNTEKCNRWFGYSKCPAWEICWGPAHVGRDPVGSGLYQIKTQFKGREEMMEENNAS